MGGPRVRFFHGEHLTPTSLYAFQIAVSRLGGGNATRVHLCLRAAWESPSRAYHGLQHLNECLALAYEWGASLSEGDRALLVLAVWFHDFIYDPARHDNEELSAQHAAATLVGLGVYDQVAQQVADLVLATKHLGDAAPASPLIDLLLDIDLAILGATAERFAEYEAQVLAEYAFVPPADYAVGRAQVLAHFRDKATAVPQTLYRTTPGQALLAQACINLARSA